MVNFIILLILHFIGDFYLQTSKIARCKNAQTTTNCEGCNNCNNKHYFNYKYIFIHTLLYVCPFLFLFHITEWTHALMIIAILFVSHNAVDIISCCLNKKFKQTLVFIADQLLHVLILLLVHKSFDYNSTFSEYLSETKLILAFLTLTIPSSVFINKIFQDLFPKAEQSKVFDVGSIIGILERILIFIFACFEDFAAIAIIVTVKTWARSSDLKEDKINFRDKYLLGTLASMVLALISFLIYK